MPLSKRVGPCSVHIHFFTLYDCMDNMNFLYCPPSLFDSSERCSALQKFVATQKTCGIQIGDDWVLDYSFWNPQSDVQTTDSSDSSTTAMSWIFLFLSNKACIEEWNRNNHFLNVVFIKSLSYKYRFQISFYRKHMSRTWDLTFFLEIYKNLNWESDFQPRLKLFYRFFFTCLMFNPQSFSRS